MMTIAEIEDAVASAAVAQGWRPGAEAMKQTAIRLAGSELVDGLIVIKNLGAISPADFVKSLHAQSPELFSNLVDDAPAKSTRHAGLTEAYAAEIAASRAKPRFTEADLSRYSGTTLAHMKERLAAPNPMKVPNRRAVGAIIAKPAPGVRKARGIVLQIYDLKRRKSEVDQRVEKACDALERVDVFGLRKELESALAEQAGIDSKLAELQADNLMMAG